MENGVKTVIDEEHQLGEMKVMEENGVELPESGEPKDAGENEVFEEALDSESFYTPHPSLQDFSSRGEETSEEALDQGVPQMSDGPAEAQSIDLDPEEQEAIYLEKFNEAFVAELDSQSLLEEAAGSDEKIEFRDEADGSLQEAAEVEKDVYLDASVLEDGEERVTECSERELAGEKSEDEEFNSVTLDVSQPITDEKSEDVELDGVDANGSHPNEQNENVEAHESEPKQHVPYQDGIVEDRQDNSVNLDVHSNSSHPSCDRLVTDNGITNASVADVCTSPHTAGVEEALEQDGENLSSDKKPEANEIFEKESVLMEELSESSSTDDDDNQIRGEPALTTDSHPTRTPGPPPLPFHPTGLGSSTPLSSDKKPEANEIFEKESVLMEDLSESSSTDDDDNQIRGEPALTTDSHPTRTSGPPPLPFHPTGLGSSTPLSESSGTPVLPSRPSGLGSSAPLTKPTASPALPSRPAGLGSSAPLLEPAHRSLQQPRVNASTPQRQSNTSDELSNDDAEENDETRQKLQMIRVKFLRLARRLGQTPHNAVVAQVLYRLGLAEQLRRITNRAGVFSFEQANVMAEQLETAGQEPLDFSCTIMVIGKSGVGKSSTINSIFDEVKLPTNVFHSGTKKVQDVVGTVQGIKVRVIDTPGLSPSSFDQRKNEKILRSVKKFSSKTPPDIVLYCDRLDIQSRDYGDVPLLRTIAEVFGPSIWFNAIVVLTHAASAPPEGANGTPLSYEMFVSQRSLVVQQAIHKATGDGRLMNPVSLVENHSACRMNRAGQRVLPNGQVWKPQLLLLSFSSKILAEANMLLKLQDSPPGKPFGYRSRVPPLPYLLSSLLQSRPQLKLPEEQFGDEYAMDEDHDEASDSDGGSDYDELPPFKPLNKAQLNKLSKSQRKAYFEEVEYREKLFFRKQLKEERKRRKLMKKMAAAAKDHLPNDNDDDNLDDENSGPASVPVPMPDYALPVSFDSDNPCHRYRFLDNSSQWLVRPVLDSQGWDHDVGYEGLNVERLFLLKDKIPVSVSGQLTKDKKDCNLQMELASSLKHGEGKASSLGLDMQTVGKDMAYTFRGESRFKNFRRNNTAAGLSVTVLGDTVSAGMKVEDKLIVSKTLRLLMSGGAMTGRGDVAYGGRFEATLRDKDYPVGRMLSTLALSVVDWHGELALSGNVQSQIPVGRGTNLIGHVNLSNKGSGQISIRLNSSEQLQIALLALVPIIRNVGRFFSQFSDRYAE